MVAGAALAAITGAVTAVRRDHRNPFARHIGREVRQPIELILGPAVLDRNILSLDIACVLQAPMKPAYALAEAAG